MLNIFLKKSFRKDKKWMVIIDGKTIHFGANGMSDYTIHQDKERMKRYTQRHMKRENWNKSGIKTAGFWSKWLLWNKPSLLASKKDIEKRFNVKIRKHTVNKNEKRSPLKKNAKGSVSKKSAKGSYSKK